MRFIVLAAVVTVLFILSPLGSPMLGMAFNYFSSVPLLMVGLSLGLTQLTYSALIATTLLALFANPLTTAAFVGVQVIPIWFIAQWALKKKPAMAILTHLTIILMAGFTGIVFAFPLFTGQFLQPWLAETLKLNDLGQIVSSQVILLSPGLLGISWLLMMAFNALLAQRLLHARKVNLRKFPTKQDFHPPQHWDIVFLIGLLLTLIAGDGNNTHFWALNMLLLSCVPLSLVGLRIFYLWLMQFSVAKIWFFVMLFIMFILMWPMMIIIGLGLIEPVLKLYPRFKKNH